MRLLENCIDNSASSEMKGQIEALREAFSVDINRPFVLNPSFPFYHGVTTSIDPHIARAYTQAEAVASTMASSQVTYATHPLSPPHSIGDVEPKGESPAAVQSLVMLATGHGAQASAQGPLVENINWNPSRLFEYLSLSLSLSLPANRAQGTGIQRLGLTGRWRRWRQARCHRSQCSIPTTKMVE